MGLFLCRQVGSVGSFPGRLLNRISSCEMGACMSLNWCARNAKAIKGERVTRVKSEASI